MNTRSIKSLLVFLVAFVLLVSPISPVLAQSGTIKTAVSNVTVQDQIDELLNAYRKALEYETLYGTSEIVVNRFGEKQTLLAGDFKREN